MTAYNRLFLIGFLITLAGTVLSGCASAPAPVEDRAATPAARSNSPIVPERPAVVTTLPPLALPPAGTAPAAPPQAGRSPEALFYALATLGVDYRSGGRSHATGFDCSGLVSHIYAEAYGRRIPANTRAQSSLGGAVPISALEPGDLVFFNTLQRPYSHVGIYIGDERFVHAPRTGAAVRIESLRARYWSARFDGARRLIE